VQVRTVQRIEGGVDFVVTQIAAGSDPWAVKDLTPHGDVAGPVRIEREEYGLLLDGSLGPDVPRSLGTAAQPLGSVGR
jgi:hypothetical protein